MGDVEYAITKMADGKYRAECHVRHCGWWLDVEVYETALTVLRKHVALHPDVLWQRQREEVRSARPDPPPNPRAKPRTKEKVCEYCGGDLHGQQV